MSTKRTVRRLAGVLALCLILCLSLCSCKELDEAKAHHATWTDESKENVMLDGQKYRQLDLPINSMYLTESGYCTEKDVPVLLAEFFGYNINFSRELGILSAFVSARGQDVFYCREDRYDQLMKEGVDGDYTCYSMSVVRYDSGDWKEIPMLVDEAFADLINRVLVPENRITEGSEDEEPEEYAGSMLSLCRCTESGLFSDLDVSIEGDLQPTYIRTWKDSIPTVSYLIPPELRQAIGAFVEKCVQVQYEE